jgi:hypothetical protein
VFYYTERDVRCKIMAEGKIIDVTEGADPETLVTGWGAQIWSNIFNN